MRTIFADQMRPDTVAEYGTEGGKTCGILHVCQTDGRTDRNQRLMRPSSGWGRRTLCIAQSDLSADLWWYVLSSRDQQNVDINYHTSVERGKLLRPVLKVPK